MKSLNQTAYRATGHIEIPHSVHEICHWKSSGTRWKRWYESRAALTWQRAYTIFITSRYQRLFITTPWENRGQKTGNLRINSGIALSERTVICYCHAAWFRRVMTHIHTHIYTHLYSLWKKWNILFLSSTHTRTHNNSILWFTYNIFDINYAILWWEWIQYFLTLTGNDWKKCGKC